MKSKKLLLHSYRKGYEWRATTDGCSRIQMMQLSDSKVIQELCRDLEPNLLKKKPESERVMYYLSHFLFSESDPFLTVELKKLISEDFYTAIDGLKQFILQKKIVHPNQIDVEMKVQKQQFFANLRNCQCLDVAFNHPKRSSSESFSVNSN